MGKLKQLTWALTRRKPMDVSEEAPTDLNRCLNTLDLTAMGVGATLGFGLYVLSGEVAAQKAGPGVVLSFMIAAIASTLSALCYAEFAAKVPKSGSAYAYSYITVGEFVAFVIGWNLTLEHVIGTASLACGYSGYLGSLFGMPKANHSLPDPNLPQFLQGYVTHFDWLAFMLTMLVTGLLLLGVEVSSKFQITFASINLCVASFIFICGLFKADFHNWSLSTTEIPANAGSGGFLPFGFTGVIAGAGTCFFAFVGFDGIAASAEEVKNPRKAIPNSILWTSAIIFVTYCCMATIQTLIWPYWDQNQAAPLPYIFDKLGMPFARWTVLVGVLAGLSTSFVGGFLPLPRILYAMARDGVIYRVLAVINKRFKVPIVATIVGGILIACLASMLAIDQLADMLSIGTLAAYSLVSISVLLLRYEHQKPTECENPLPITYMDGIEGKQMDQLAIADAAGSGLMPTYKEQSMRLTGNGGPPEKHDIGASSDAKKSSRSSKRKSQEEENHINSTEAQVLQAAKKPPTGNTNRSSSAKGSVVSNTNSVSKLDGLNESNQSRLSNREQTSSSASSSSSPFSSSSSCSYRSIMALFMEGTRLPSNAIRRPDPQTTHASRCIILLIVIVTTLLDYALVVYGPTLYLLEPVAIISCVSLLVSTLLLGYLLNRLPVAEPSKNSFEVPMVPLIPIFSVIINTYLMLNLSIATWIRFAVWMTIGFFIYFTYGIFNSTGYKDSRCD